MKTPVIIRRIGNCPINEFYEKYGFQWFTGHYGSSNLPRRKILKLNKFKLVQSPTK